MYHAHDPEHGFYYEGSVEPHPRLYSNWFRDTTPQVISIDVETISLKERIAIGVGISVRPDISFYFTLFPNESPAVPWYLLKDDAIPKVLHNALFDLLCLREYEVSNEHIRDTSSMSRLLLYKFNKLIDLSHIHKMEVHEVKDTLADYGAKIMLDLPEEVVAHKCMQDTAATLKTYHELLPRTDLTYFNTEMETIPIMVNMSNQGLKIDQEARLDLEEMLEEEVAKYLAMCEEVEGFKPSSPQQVSYILAKRGAYHVFPKLPFTRNKFGRATGNLSTDAAVLEKMDDPLARIILYYRTNAKLLNTYVKPWANEDRATTRYHLDAITGRPSSTDRNMQNIPGANSPTGIDARRIMLPDNDIWSDMDFSQLELRILAHWSQDREMFHIFETDGDIHQIVADFLGIVRNIAKNVNFAMIYGGTDSCLAETAHIQSKARCAQLRDMWFQLFPQAGDYIQTVQEEVKRGRSVVTTLFGRNMRLPDFEDDSLDGRQRKAINYPIQGTAADILKRGLIKLKDLPMALQVHDEILVDGLVPDYRFRELEHIAPFSTPVEVKYLRRWE